MAELKLTGLDGVLDLLKSLPPELVSKRGGPVKRALLKGARVIQREVALNLFRVVQGGDFTDDEKSSTGLLQSSLIASRGKQPFGGNGERYLVRFKRKTYNRKGAPVTTLKTANLLEYGGSRQRAEPFIRPAFQSKAGDAIRTIERELLLDLERTVRKLSKGR